MPSILSETVFSEPSGRPQSLTQFGTAVAFLAIYAWVWSAGDPESGRWLLGMAFGTGLSGLAESLPAHRRRAAGVVRVGAILVLLSLVGAIVLAPEYLVW